MAKKCIRISAKIRSITSSSTPPSTTSAAAAAAIKILVSLDAFHSPTIHEHTHSRGLSRRNDYIKMITKAKLTIIIIIIIFLSLLLFLSQDLAHRTHIYICSVCPSGRRLSMLCYVNVYSICS